MAQAPPPTSLSLFRGHAPAGIGEGEAYRAKVGEQYIEADAPLDQRELLAAARSWFTLVAPSSDHRGTSHELVSWSLFNLAGYRFVVRLCSSREYKRYDPRDAYFAHGRAWTQDALTSVFDPGVFLGRPDHFEAPWPKYDRAIVIPDSWGSVPWLDEHEEPHVALLMAWLYQAMVQGIPLVIAAPLQEFTDQGTLARLVSLARLGLPLRLKQTCSLRLYSDTPRAHLDNDRVNLLALPDRQIDEVRRTHGHAIILNWAGEQLAGPGLGELYWAYADNVVSRIARLQQRAPQALLAFSKRIDMVLGHDLAPSHALIESLLTIYNLAFAVQREPSKDSTESLLRGYLVPHAGRGWGGLLPEHLLEQDDLEHVSDEALFEVLLGSTLPPATPEEALHTGERSETQLLRHLAESELRQRGSIEGGIPEARVEAWWSDNGANQIGHLAFLRSRGLVRPELVARLTQHLPMTVLFSNATAAEVFIDSLSEAPTTSEGATSALDQRLREDEGAREFMRSAPIGGSRPDKGNVLVAKLPTSCLNGRVASSYLLELARDLPDPTLLELAQELAKTWWHRVKMKGSYGPDTVEGWDDLVVVILDRLLRMGPMPSSLVNLFSKVEQRKEAQLPIDLVLHLRELGSRNGQPPTTRLGDERYLNVDSPELQRQIVRWALLHDWESLNAQDLCRPDGTLRLPSTWIAGALDEIVGAPALLTRLNATTLCMLWGLLREREQPVPAHLVRLVSGHFRQEPERITALLIDTGLWFSWARAAELEQVDRRRAALLWLACQAWLQPKPPPATSGAWREAMSELPPPPDGPGISAVDMAALLTRDGLPRWPWLNRLEQDQLSDLASRCIDLTAVWRLANAVKRSERFSGPVSATLPEQILGLSPIPVTSTLAFNAVRTKPQPDFTANQHALDLEWDELVAIIEHAGPRARLATERLAVALFVQLHRRSFQDTDRDTIERLNLWHEPNFLWQLRLSLSQSQNLDRWPQWVLESFDTHADRLTTPQSPPATDCALALLGRGYHRAARSLDPQAKPATHPPAPSKDYIAQCVLDLAHPDSPRDYDAWHWLANQAWTHSAFHGGAEPHPVSRLLQKVNATARGDDVLASKLGLHGRPLFLSALSQHQKAYSLLSTAGAGQSTLPAFDLLQALKGRATTGQVMWELLATQEALQWSNHGFWWKALVESLKQPRNMEGDRVFGVPVDAILLDLAEQIPSRLPRGYALPAWRALMQALRDTQRSHQANRQPSHYQ